MGSKINTGRSRGGRAVPRPGKALVNGRTFTGQGRLVHAEHVAAHEQGVGGHPLTLTDQDEVPRDKITGGQLLFEAVAKGADVRLRQDPQGRQRPLAAGFLENRQPHGHAGGRDEKQPLGQIAQDQVEQRRAHHQHEHRLANVVGDDAQDVAGARLRKLISSELGPTRVGFRVRQTMRRRCLRRAIAVHQCASSVGTRFAQSICSVAPPRMSSRSCERP